MKKAEYDVIKRKNDAYERALQKRRPLPVKLLGVLARWRAELDRKYSEV
jgi:hypothetical protein